VIDRNTGFAHMTRGVNAYTLIALRSCVSAADVGVLSEMLSDKETVVRRAAAGVLTDLGRPGRAALEAARKQARDAASAAVIDEALSSEARPLSEYPLTERERAKIRGCQSMR
jgi:hypothetical protein